MPDESQPVTTILRDNISGLLEAIKREIGASQPPAVQELVLAQRHLEDARMRLGVAEAYNKGFDPWKNKVDAKPEAPKTDDSSEEEKE